MRYTVFDIEGNSLNPTVIHCLSYQVIENGKPTTAGTLTDYDQMRDFFKSSGILVGHNIIRWDIPHLERLLRMRISNILMDTLAISWYLFPERKAHGLESWGEDLDIPKPEIEDWENQSLRDYIHRCEMDVKINTKLFLIQLSYLNELYEGSTAQVFSIIKYLSFKLDCAKEQEAVRWKLDIPKCQNKLEWFTEELTKKERLLVEAMPEKVNYKEVRPPKKMRTKDGSLSKRGENWFSILNELGLEETFQGKLQIEKSREPGNPHSTIQLKKWLTSLGWEPKTFKYNKDKETGKINRVPQISLPFGQGVCPSVQKLYEKEPSLENIEGFFVLQHRIGILKGFLRDISEDGYLMAEIAGLTNTLRFKHTTIVNLPGYTGKGDWKDGEHIRGCLTIPEGHTLCGSDMASLEDRTKQHYMYFFDPEYVQEMTKPGFDPHLDLAGFAHKLTGGEIGMSEEDIKWFKHGYHDEDKTRYQILKGIRGDFKTVNYAAVYGSGAPTMSRTSGMSLKRCRVLLDAYWEKNWAVKRVAKSLKIKVVRGQMWLLNPVSQFWYSLRYEKDKFSTLNQGTGVYCFDNWVREARDAGLKMCGQFHDEIVAPIQIGKEELTRKILLKAIDNVNKRLNLNRKLSIDIQFGSNYAEVH